MEERIPREVKSVAQSHTAQLCQCQDSNPRHGGWVPTTALFMLPLHIRPFTSDFTVRGLDRHSLVPNVPDPSALTGQSRPPGSNARTGSLCPGPIAGAHTAARPWELRAPLQMGSTSSPQEGPQHPSAGVEAGAGGPASSGSMVGPRTPVQRDLAPAQARGHCPLGEAGSQRTTAESLEQPLLRLTERRRLLARLVAAKAQGGQPLAGTDDVHRVQGTGREEGAQPEVRPQLSPFSSRTHRPRAAAGLPRK